VPTKEEVDAYDLRYADQLRCPVGDGVELYYELRGEGPPLTLINNMFLISPLWRSFTDRLERKRRLLTYDLRNQGASTRREGAISLAEHVTDLERLLDHLEIERTMLLGTSVSTLIARDFALRHPERVSALILVGPTFSAFGSRRRELLAKSWLRMLEAGGPAALFGNLYPQVLGDKAIQEGGAAGYLALKERFLALNSPQQLQSNLAASLSSQDEPGALDEISCPILLLAGDGDFLASRSSLQEMAKGPADATVEILPHAGHIPFFDVPEAFQDAVECFLGEIKDRERI
jgi:3-oxoadipate enol-lactonase